MQGNFNVYRGKVDEVREVRSNEKSTVSEFFGN